MHPDYHNPQTGELILMSLANNQELTAHLLNCVQCTNAQHLCLTGYRLSGRVCPGCSNTGLIPHPDQTVTNCDVCGGPPKVLGTFYAP